ncbi:MAG: hypothetical protein PHV32_04015 [Eubacteriales bacterium]|nr:hypothetical protein [Eubacteriales bacterium]
MYRRIIVGALIPILFICTGCQAKSESNLTTALAPETTIVPTSDPTTETEDILETNLKELFEEKEMEDRELTILPPVRTLESISDVYPIAGKCSVFHTGYGDKSIWSVRRNLWHVYFMIIKENNEKVYVALTSDEIVHDNYIENSSPENVKISEKIDITTHIVKKGMDVENIQIEFLGYREGETIVFRIYDLDNSTIVYSKWQNGKHTKTHFLDDRIADVKLFNTSGDSKACLYKDNGKQWVVWDTGNYYAQGSIMLSDVIKYELPDDIGDIQAIDCGGDFGNDMISLMCSAADKNSIYYINLNDNSVQEQAYFSDWEESLSLAWTFQSDLSVNYIEAVSDDIVVVVSTDGEISGHHYHDNIYGINRNTGEKIWAVYGGYFILDYKISSYGNVICIEIIENDERSKLLCLEINSGKILWEKIYDKSNTNGEFFKLLKEIVPGSKLIISSTKRFDNSLPLTITVLDLKNGDVLEEFEVPYDDLFAVTGNASSFILEKNNQLFRYDLNTGKTKKITEERIVQDSGTPPIKPVYESPTIKYPYVQEDRTKWVAFENSFKLLDLNKGEVLVSIPSSGYSDDRWYLDRLYTVNNDTVLVSADKSFIVYKTDGTLLWEKEERFEACVYKDELLYYITDTGLKCVELATGEPEWERDFSFSKSYIRNPIIIDNLIAVPAGNIYIFDIETGEFKCKINNNYLQKISIEEQVDTRYGDYYKAFYSDGSGLYICNRNGYIECFN